MDVVPCDAAHPLVTVLMFTESPPTKSTAQLLHRGDIFGIAAAATTRT
jgi:hypothetical protein